MMQTYLKVSFPEFRGLAQVLSDCTLRAKPSVIGRREIAPASTDCPHRFASFDFAQNNNMLRMKDSEQFFAYPLDR